MTEYQLDDVDRRLLNLLQQDARSTATELAEEVGVSDNTVHNRMERLEEAGIVTGYSATIDYRSAGLGLYFQFTCTARISVRAEVAREVMEIPEVVEATELMTGQQNLHVRVLGARDEDITRVAERIDELELEIDDEYLVREEHVQPLDFVEIAESLELEE